MAIGIGSLIGLGTSLIGGIFGGGQARRARRLEANLETPQTEVNQNLLQNVAQAELMAGVGLPQQQYTNALQNIQRAQNAGLRQASRSGGIGSIASVLRGATDATANLDVTDANARLQNQRLAMQQRSALAQEEQRVFNVNEMQPYLMQLQRIQQLRGAGQRNIFGALGNVAQMGIGGLLGGTGGGGLFGGTQSVPNTFGLSGQTMGLDTNQQPFGLPLGGFQTTL